MIEFRVKIASVAIVVGVLFLFTSYKFILVDKQFSTRNEATKVGSTLFYNEQLVYDGVNYPICDMLESFSNLARIEEKHADTERLKYQRLLDDNEMVCGKERIKGGFLYLKSIIRPWTGCPQEIVGAKRRLINYIQEMCQAQEIARTFCNSKQLLNTVTHLNDSMTSNDVNITINRRRTAYVSSSLTYQQSTSYQTNYNCYPIIVDKLPDHIDDNSAIELASQQLESNKNQEKSIRKRKLLRSLIDQSNDNNNQSSTEHQPSTLSSNTHVQTQSNTKAQDDISSSGSNNKSPDEFIIHETIDNNKDNNYNINKKIMKKSIQLHTLRRGVIYTGKAEHYHDIYQSIMAFHMINMTLPIEVWVNANSYLLCKRIFHSVFDNVQCIPFSSGIKGFVSKFYALLYTTLDEAIFVDADNLAVRDVTEIFESPEFKQTGAILWPDNWGHSCENITDDSMSSMLSGGTTHRDFVLWKANFLGLSWDNTFEKTQETEAGQMAWDLRRHKGVINLGRKLMEDGKFFNKIINGDKDIFRFIFLFTRIPVHIVRDLPGYTLDSNGQRDCLIHYHVVPNNPLSYKLPLFFHQFKTRNPTSFLKYIRPLPTSIIHHLKNTLNGSNKQNSESSDKNGNGGDSNDSNSSTSDGTNNKQSIAIANDDGADVVKDSSHNGIRLQLFHNTASFCLRVLLYFDNRMEIWQPNYAEMIANGNINGGSNSNNNVNVDTLPIATSGNSNSNNYQRVIVSHEFGQVTKYMMETPVEALQLYVFAQNLFQKVDEGWKEHDFIVYCYTIRDEFLRFMYSYLVVFGAIIIILFIIRLIVSKNNNVLKERNSL